MTASIFRQSIGIGVGCGFIVAVFCWLTHNNLHEPPSTSQNRSGYLSLDEIAQSWREIQTSSGGEQINPQMVGVPAAKPENSLAEIDQSGPLPSSTASHRTDLTQFLAGQNFSLEAQYLLETADANQGGAMRNQVDQAGRADQATFDLELARNQPVGQRFDSAQPDYNGTAGQGQPGRDTSTFPSVAPIRTSGLQANPYLNQRQPSPHPKLFGVEIQASEKFSPVPINDESGENLGMDWGQPNRESNRAGNPNVEGLTPDPMRFQGSKSETSILVNNSQRSIPASPRIQHEVTVRRDLSDSAALRGAQHIEYGKTLARRGATATAENEFTAALMVLARDHDLKTGSNRFSESLTRGLLALKESEDFAARDARSQLDVDIQALCETHQSGALPSSNSRSLNTVQALQVYLSFAQQQIELGVGHNVVAAEALYCLGKLRTAQQLAGLSDSNLDAAKSIVFHRVALACDQRNYRSAHELGVLMAHLGELNQAQELLKQSLRIQPTAKSWENLAKLHQRMNEPQLAQLAFAEQQRMADSQESSALRWVEPPQLQRYGYPENQAVYSNPQPQTTPNPATIRQADSRNETSYSREKSWTDRLKFW